MHAIRSLAAAAALAMLSACGWHPLYASRGPDATDHRLAEISVALLPERSGQLLRLALQERFQRFDAEAVPRYDLNVSYGVSAEGIAVRQDNTVTRIRFVGFANWKLTAQDPQHTTLTSGFSRSTDGYDIIDQEYFAADQNNDTVQRRLAEAVADQITLQISAYFDQHGGHG